MRQMILYLIIAMTLGQNLFATTYYVRRSGNDGAAGTSWATAKATVGAINTAMGKGDTVYFGTGLFRAPMGLRPDGGTSSDHQCWACSSFVAGICSVYVSTNLSGWTNISGYVYYHYEDWDSTTQVGLNHYGVFQDTMPLNQVASLSAVTSAGKYAVANDTTYVWLWENKNPATQQIEASCNPIVFNQLRKSQSYTDFYGFVFRYMAHNGFMFGQGPSSAADTCTIQHCDIQYISTNTGNDNASAIYFSGNTTEDASANDITIRGCTIGNVWNGSFDINHRDDNASRNSSGHGCGMCIYGLSGAVIESCLFVGHFAADCIEYKSGPMGHNIIGRYNIFQPRGCFVIYGIKSLLTVKDSVYGNIFNGGDAGGSGSNCGSGLYIYGGGSSDTLEFLNNTLYNCGEAVRYNNEFDATRALVKSKFSIFYEDNNTYGGFFGVRDDDVPNDTLRYLPDSNMYYAPATYRFCMNTGGTLFDNWTQWQAYLNRDAHSTQGTDPGFTNGDAGDFSRPLATQQMNQTYGGKTWTIYGAWQPPACPPPGVTTLLSPAIGINNLHNPVTFDWDDVVGADRYQIQVDDNSYFNSPEIDQQLTVSTRIASSLANGTTFYWRVRAYSDSCGWGNWNFVWSFSIADTIPPATTPDLR